MKLDMVIKFKYDIVSIVLENNSFSFQKLIPLDVINATKKKSANQNVQLFETELLMPFPKASNSTLETSDSSATGVKSMNRNIWQEK